MFINNTAGAEYQSICISGRNTPVDVGTEDVWTGGAIYAVPTTARVHALVSGSANDTAAGTGARTVRVSGLSSTYTLLEEVVTMNGTTPVNTTNSFLRVNSLQAISWGTGKTNAGAITATAATDATVSSRIETGRNKSESTVFSLPIGKTAFMTSWWAQINKAAITTGCDAALQIAEGINVAYTGWRYEQFRGMVSLGSSAFQHIFTVPLVITGPSDIKISATSGVASMDISAGYEMAVR